MPYPNEHACRIRQPSAFEKGSFRRIKRNSISIIIGKLKGKKTTTTQAFRYPKDKKHCKDNKGMFEAAGSTQESVDRNPFLPDFFQGGL